MPRLMRKTWITALKFGSEFLPRALRSRVAMNKRIRTKYIE